MPCLTGLSLNTDTWRNEEFIQFFQILARFVFFPIFETHPHPLPIVFLQVALVTHILTHML